MPDWSNEVPNEAGGTALPIRRTPPHSAMIAVVTSTDLTGTMTHYWKSRTMPHEKMDCEPCRNGIPKRWHSYLSAWEAKSQMHFLFELTAQAAQHFVTYRKAHGTLRGCLFRATRWRNIPNGRVLIECKPTDIVTHPIPEAPDLVAVLSVLWNLPKSQVESTAPIDDEETKIVELIAQRSQYSPAPPAEKANGRVDAEGQKKFL